MTKLLILGLDGLDPYFVEEHREELPHLAGGSVLESTLPPITVPAWASSFTGRKPEKLDRFDFQVIDFDSYDFTPEPHTGFFGKEFWSYMDGKAAIADVPGADLREIDGWMMAGLFDVSEDSSHPPELVNEMEEELGDIQIEGLENYDTEKERREAAFSFFERRKDMLYWLLDSRDADVYFTVFRLPDTMMHHCSNDRQMLEAYKKCDEMVSELKERDVDMLVVSDHGAVKATRRFSVNTWLQENGFLEQKAGENRSRLKNLALRAAEFAERFGFRDYLVWANERYRDVAGEEFVDRNLDLDTVDWSRTEAFSYMTGVCRYSGIWVNDDRFSNGAVEDREAKKQEIKQEMEKHELVERVLTKEEAFAVDAETFPDLVAVLGGKVKNDSDIKPSVTGKISSYMHRRDGYIATHGDVFSDVESAELIDLAPTVLHYFGNAVPEEMDGDVLGIFAEGSEPGKREPERFSGEVEDLDF